MTIKIGIEVNRRLLLELLTTAVEQGSGYWADFSRIKREDDVVDGFVNRPVRSVSIKLLDPASMPKFHPVVTVEDMGRGLERLAKCAATGNKYHDGTAFPAAAKHLAAALSENGDQWTADVVLQMVLFNEVVYG